jgi:hypothetical protein
VGNRVGKIGSVKNVGSDPTVQLLDGGAGLVTASAKYEHAIENRSVGGSIPPLGTNDFNNLAKIVNFKKMPCPHCVRVNLATSNRRQELAPAASRVDALSPRTPKRYCANMRQSLPMSVVECI